MLLEAGAKVSADQRGLTPVHLAAAVGDPTLLQMLLQVNKVPLYNRCLIKAFRE